MNYEAFWCAVAMEMFGDRLCCRGTHGLHEWLEYNERRS